MSSNLKTCPFCGGSARVVLKQWDLFMAGAVVECTQCGARTTLIKPSAEYSAKDLAIRKWNTRTS